MPTPAAVPAAGAAAAPPLRLSTQDRLALVATMMAVALVTLDSTLINTALPAIAADLHAPPAQAIWVVNAYQLAVAGGLLPFAALGDRLGARKVHLAGLVFYMLATLGCLLADSLPTLAVARALQGIGGAALMSVNIALVRQIYPPQHLGRGVGLNALVVGASFAAGPSLASLVLAVGPWHWLFAISLPVAALALAVAWPTLPRPSRPGLALLDPITALCAAVCFAGLIGALSAATQRQPVSVFGPVLAVALAAGALLLHRQAGHPAPMLPVDLLRRPMFTLSIATAMCSFCAQGLAFVSLPFFFETVLHRNPVQTGFLMAPWAIVVAAAAPLAGRLSDSHAPGLMGGIGLTILSVGMVAMATLPGDATVLRIALSMALCGLGFGLFQSPNLKAIMSSAPPERSGGASGMVAMARLNGQAIGSALVALCFGIAAGQGPVLALALGAAFAALGAAASAARLWVR